MFNQILAKIYKSHNLPSSLFILRYTCQICAPYLEKQSSSVSHLFLYLFSHTLTLTHCITFSWFVG
jgi:hypothetical protein